MKWSEIIKKVLEKLESQVSPEAITLKKELESALHDKELKWKIFKKWIIASIAQAVIQIVTVLMNLLA